MSIFHNLDSNILDGGKTKKKPYNFLPTKQNIKLMRWKTFDMTTDFLRNKFTGRNAEICMIFTN